MTCRPKTRRRKRIRAALPQVCVHCGAMETLTLDHIVPRVYGGTNEPSNFQLLCPPCHQLKSKTEVRHWDPRKNLLKGQLLTAMLNDQRAARGTD